ncbi:MAG: phosphoribosylanthranilate isomerase [Gammaproteobacteria bacterium]|nr:phosphoribosylanthranilate isomerase [Gammaproteobacteria bacterium]NNJ84940.1 phosphoribosylanthranilate isomerase [Gammaproteobacteria bacterium]
MRTRIKICGITRPEDALATARLGADAIGLVFYPPSPRAITLEKAHAIAAALPPFVTLVALFVNPDRGLVEEVIDALPVGILQFHGDESPTDCERYQRPYIKAVRMQEGVVLSDAMARFASAAGLLLDAHREGMWGGTGERFDWTRIPTDRTLPLVLAGGLDPDNVREAVRMVRPFAVDVSGGVESAKGIKDAEKMARFIARVDGAGS